MHAAFMDPHSHHWPLMSVLNAAHAGELFIKAIIAQEHPLLIFKDLKELDTNESEDLSLSTLISRGKTHDFEKLPQILWATTGLRLADPDCFKSLRLARNAIQHFCPPEERDLSGLSLSFIYTVLDPLIRERFGLYAIEYHEDHNIGYDYLVSALLRRQLRFSMPTDFDLTEIDIATEIEGATDNYKMWVAAALTAVGKSALLNKQ
jgi:hypothetical protein